MHMSDWLTYEIKAPPCGEHFGQSAPVRSYADAELTNICRDINRREPERAVDRLFRLLDTRKDLAQRLSPQIQAIVDRAMDIMPPRLRFEYMRKLGGAGFHPTLALAPARAMVYGR